MAQSNTKATVRLTTFPNEPLARLASGRLRQEGIGSMVRPLGAGPGGWGTAATLPHALYVQAADEMGARQVLDLPPSEIAEREDSSKSRRWGPSLPMGLALLAAAAGLIYGCTALAFQ